MARWGRLDPSVVKRVLGSRQWRVSMLLREHACSGPEYAEYLLRFHVAKRVLWLFGGMEGRCELYGRRMA